MSTSIHHRQSPAPWALRRGPGAPGPAVSRITLATVVRSIGAALIPGRAAEDVVPAMQASDAQALLVHVGALPEARRSDRWDRPTADAVAAFQHVAHLPVTGIADRRTCDALLAR